MSRKAAAPQSARPPRPAAPPPACSACAHWRGKPGDERGECREGPPSVVYVQKTEVPGQAFRIVSAWPTTRADEECGRFRAREARAAAPAGDSPDAR